MFTANFTRIMRNVLVIFLLVTANLIKGTTQEYHYEDSWGAHGFTLLHQSRSGVGLNFSIGNFMITEETINGVVMKNILLPGTFLPNDEGMPNLPGQSRFIAIPNDAKVKMRVLVYRTEKLEGLDIAPAPRIPLETEDGLYYPVNTRVYSTNAFYPAEPVICSEVTTIRGVDAVIVGVTPFQYNPVTKELIVYRDIQIELTFEGGDGRFGRDEFRSYWFDPIHYDLFLNSSALPEIDYNKRRNELMSGRPTGAEYLIVTPNGPEFLQWADSIKRFRQQQGILTQVVTLAQIGGSTATQLESYFNNAYYTWDIKPVAVLLLGDYGTNTNSTIVSPIYNNYCVSDNIYADVTGNHMPDIIFARITANNATQLQTMVRKFLRYERTPPTNPVFYNKPITALGWQTERWFQICSEVIGGFWRSQGKNPTRINAIYSGTPGTVWSTAPNTQIVVNYFGPNGKNYIPATPAELGGWTGGNATMVNNAINAGAFMLQHRDHGFEDGWGEPAYYSSNINSLTNTDLTFILSINCLTGKYNYAGEVFAEKFHRHTYAGQGAGALGIIAASEVSYSFVNDTYVWGLFDNMYPQFMPEYGMPVQERGLYPAFGNASGKYFLQQSSWPYNVNNKEVTYHLFHHHGCAFMNVYSEVPQNLTVNHGPTHPSGETQFQITANQGAFIALTVNNEIIGTGVATGQPQIIQILPQPAGATIRVTITKQNFYRYTSLVQVVAQNLPNIQLEAFSINDQNGNGLMEYGETVSLNITLKNAGNATGENLVATLSSSSPYITIQSPTVQVGALQPNGSITISGAFQFSVHTTVPHMHQASFNIAVTNGQQTWDNPFVITAYAPVIQVSSVSVLDSGGNGNGLLDPGEEATILVQVENSGGSPVWDFMVSLESQSPYVIIQTNPYSMEMLSQAGSISPTFSVKVIPPAPLGILVNLNFGLNNSMIGFNAVLPLKIGLFAETFESGNFNNFIWVMAGDAPWQIDSNVSYQGNYSARSGVISHNQTSTMQIAMNVARNDQIKFYYRTSSEPTNDFLAFYIDGVLKGTWSGNTDWTLVSFSVEPGPKIFKWVYQKNSSVSMGDDCAWVDMIEFPAIVDNFMVVWAGYDGTVCEGQSYGLSGFARNHEIVEWITAGDGTFSNINILNPVYTPGPADIQNGSVILTLKAKAFITTITDQMLLTIDRIPLQSAVPAGPVVVCPDAVLTQYETPGAMFATEYEWELSPTEAGILTFNGTIASVSWNQGWIGNASLRVRGLNYCGTGLWSEPLQIALVQIPATPGKPSGTTTFCQGASQSQYSIESVTYATEYQWLLEPANAGMVSGNGNSAVIQWSPAFHGTAQLKVKAINTCGESNYSENLAITVHPLPVAAQAIQGKNKLCYGFTETYTVGSVAHATGYDWLIVPAEAASIQVNQNSCQITPSGSWSGTAQLKVRGVNDCGQGEWSEVFNLLIEDCTGISDRDRIHFNIYPNPGSGRFMLSMNVWDKITISVSDMSGKTVYGPVSEKSEGNYTTVIDVESLADGVYYLIVSGTTFRVMEKIVITR